MKPSIRANLYHLFGRLFLKEVDEKFLYAIKEAGIMPEGLEQKSDKVLLDELAEEYAALFIVSGGLPPYESVRLKGLLCQEPAIEVEEFYNRCGLILKEEWKKVFPDHLGLELAFMAYLCEREEDLQDISWRLYQKEFFERHLTNWVFDYLRDLERCTFHPFYKEMFNLTRDFLESEREHLKDFRGGDKSLELMVRQVNESFL